MSVPPAASPGTPFHVSQAFPVFPVPEEVRDDANFASDQLPLHIHLLHDYPNAFSGGKERLTRLTNGECIFVLEDVFSVSEC